MKLLKIYIIAFIDRVRNLKKLVWPLTGFALFSIFMVIIFQSDDVSTYPVGWEKTFPLTPYNLSAKNVNVSYKGKYIAAVYEGKDKKKSGIFVSISFDSGKNFFKPVKIASMQSSTEMNPGIAISRKGHIAVVWQMISKNDPNSRIFYSISRDYGATWSTPGRIKLISEMPMLPNVLYDERNYLHIFYNALSDQAFNLFHVFSEDEKVFTEPEEIADISGLRGAFFPSIFQSNENIYIVWQGKSERVGALSDDLYFINSDDYGESWEYQKKITTSMAQDGSPNIILHKDILYLVYQNNEGGNWSIKLLKGYENGERWDRVPLTISTTNADCFSPVIVTSKDEDIVIIWYDIREKNSGIFSRKYSLSTRKFGKEQMLSRRKINERLSRIFFSLAIQIILLYILLI